MVEEPCRSSSGTTVPGYNAAAYAGTAVMTFGVIGLRISFIGDVPFTRFQKFEGLWSYQCSRHGNVCICSCGGIDVFTACHILNAVVAVFELRNLEQLQSRIGIETFPGQFLFGIDAHGLFHSLLFLEFDVSIDEIVIAVYYRDD